MPIHKFEAEGSKFVGFICGPGLKGCYFCGYLASFQCDYFVGPRGLMPRRRCDRHLCEKHSTNLAKNKDACPEHAPICLAAIERRKVAAT